MWRWEVIQKYKNNMFFPSCMRFRLWKQRWELPLQWSRLKAKPSYFWFRVRVRISPWWPFYSLKNLKFNLQLFVSRAEETWACWSYLNRFLVVLSHYVGLEHCALHVYVTASGVGSRTIHKSECTSNFRVFFFFFFFKMIEKIKGSFLLYQLPLWL